MFRVFGPAAASFSVCLLAIFALRPIAIAVDLIDRPGGRKTHHGDVPIVGGLAMFLGIVFGVSILPIPGAPGAPFLAACTILVTIGLFDDRFDLSPFTRLPAQIAAAIVLLVGTGTVIKSIGDPFGIGEIYLATLTAPIFTVMIIVAAINAFNMLDGMDGLAGTMALNALLALSVLSWMGGLETASTLCLVIAASVCAFLLFNLPSARNRRMRCFMGDAGSTLLGLSVAWLCIFVSQAAPEGAGLNVSPVTTLWAVAVPLYELFWTTLRRLFRGVSPFKADRDHFHHLLLKAGFGVRAAFGIFVALAGVLATIGVIANSIELADSYSFLLLVGCGVAVVCLMYRADVLWKLMPASWRRRSVVEPPRPSVDSP